MAGTGVMLVVFAPISLMFSVVTTSYHFMKILHVVVFAIAGLFGVKILGEGLAGMQFTPAGGAITVSCRREGDTALLAIRDTGRGIKPDRLPEIFHPFRQVDRDDSIGGLGLGLSVVRGIIELHGGHIRADSPGPGQGSTFTITLPVMSTGE